MPSLPGVVPRRAPRKSRPRLSFHPCTSVWSVERDEPVLDVTRAPRGPWRGGFSYSFGKMGLPTLAPAALHPPLSANEVLPKLRAGFKTTTKKKKKEAQTYSRKGLPGGSRRRTRRGPRPEMVTAASRRLRISPSPPLPSFGTPRSVWDAPSDAGPCSHHLVHPQSGAAPGFCGKHPPTPKPPVPPLHSCLCFLARAPTHRFLNNTLPRGQIRTRQGKSGSAFVRLC